MNWPGYDDYYNRKTGKTVRTRGRVEDARTGMPMLLFRDEEGDEKVIDLGTFVDRYTDEDPNGYR